MGTEEEEEYDEIVEEVVKRLVENNLYVRPEKYKWKIRKVGFLEVVIGPKEIKMEKEKARGVLDWPMFKHIEVFETSQLLLVVYQIFCTYS